MAKNGNATTPEQYAREKADAWLFDVNGFCPFTRVRLQSVLCSAFADGAASTTGKGTLTPRQRDAVLDVLNERLAGGVEDLRDALGITMREADDMMRVLARVVDKLKPTPRPRT